ncbi:DUF4174 domain-containing protein [Albimonas sp. CAU 1670]|uniref:DUF4174 domain-containing protein n=1 Tax=Albimonas sp. CAU 1670 TaxID=3032599 RepID=UPI0023DC9C64|nr:DUF4174 domain-containing protein [Albimonas sp. CAU 1670]MDF2233277.1 DUF4174 domain-containing protein [Albimonas sp. CAU 1670]
MSRSVRPLRLAAAAVLALSAAASAQPQGVSPLPPQTQDLSAWSWQARPLLIFADSAQDHAYRAQIEALQGVESELEARDVVLLADVDPDGDGALRRKLGVEGFAAILVGKDGGVKLREPHPVAPAELFALIDAMPMRRREMQAD